ncbi:hypothetical protein QR680_017441 [Steinernema hermaphroditum]|uniref:Calponin-homology (CH) domain-containing protein n=1 Tax=Steinernema hermaphroditum TaxID=289476 RepID=A0AA39HEK4_9BILA|nr:hypothetical protein QR680_017441 [Steinernema hermaphroditum]
METGSSGSRKRRRPDSESECVSVAERAHSEAPSCCAASVALSNCSYGHGSQCKLSPGSQKVLRLICGYVKLYMHRLEKQTINYRIADIVARHFKYYGCAQFAALGGLLNKVKGYGWCTPLKKPVVWNFSLLLEILDQMERNISEVIWCAYYLMPRYSESMIFLQKKFLDMMIDPSANVERQTPLLVQLTFSGTVLRTIYGIREAVVNRNWNEVGRRIALINCHSPDIKSDTAQHHYYIADMLRYRFYTYEIFHAGLQRILFHNFPDDITLDSIFQFSKQFLKLESRNITIWRQLNVAILVDLSVLGIIYEREDIQTFIQKESSRLYVIRDPEDNFVLQCYNLLYKYELWYNSNVKSKERAIYLAEQIESQLTDLRNHSAAVLLDIIIHLLLAVKRPEELVCMLSEYCASVPSLLGHCFHRIAQFGDQEAADQVLLDTFAANPDLHPSDAMWLDFVQPRTLAPENFGAASEVVMRNVSILFEFLDFGTNRTDERAWFLLKSNFESLMFLEGGMAILPPNWQHRRDWWPSFHDVELSSLGKESRTFVFKFVQWDRSLRVFVTRSSSEPREGYGKTASWKPSKRRDTAEGPSATGGVAVAVPAPLKASAQKQIRSRTVEKVCEDATLSGSLNLSERKLKEFPAILASKFDITDLIFADVSGNRMQDFSPCFGTLYSLETLLLRHNCLRVIPSTISSLSQLSYLDLRGNQLRSLPSELFSLPIKILLLTGNRLETLPREVRQSANHLQELDASCNRLKSIPCDIALLKNLRVLNLRCNQLVQIPPEVCQLELRIFDVSSNRLSSLPGEIKNMSVGELRIHDNPLIHPPISVAMKGKEHAFKWLRSQEPTGRTLRKLTDVNMNRSIGVLHASSSLRKVNRASWETESSRDRGFRVFRYNTLGGTSDSGYVSMGDERQSTELSSLSSASSNLETLKDESTEAPRIEEVMNAFSQSQTFVNNENVTQDDVCADFVNNNDVPLPSTERATEATSTTPPDTSKLKAPTETPRLQKAASTVPKAVVTPLNRSNAAVATVQPMKRVIPKAASPSESLLVKPKTVVGGAVRSPNGVAKSKVLVSGLKKPSTVTLATKTRLAKSTSSSTASVSISSTASSLSSVDASATSSSPVEAMRRVLEHRLSAKFPVEEGELAQALSDGVQLCNLANRLRPRSVINVMTAVGKAPLIPLKCKRNAEGFVAACRKIGVDESQLCSSADILGKNVYAMARTVVALQKIVGRKPSGTKSLVSASASNRRRVVTNV